MDFEKEKQAKERQIETLTKELQDIKLQIRAEKRKLDEVEGQEDILDDEKARLLTELDRLDHEFEMIEAQRAMNSSSDGNPADAITQEDDDLLIQKLEQESAYLTKLLQQAEEDNVKKAEEVKTTVATNQMLEIENQNLEHKLKDIVSLDDELHKLQEELSVNLDEEKRLFEENVKLLQSLKQLELADQEVQKNFQERNVFLRVMKEQALMERKARSFENILHELNEKLEYKTKLFNQIKWKLDKANSIVNDADIKKVIGIDAFKQKVEKFSLDLNQLVETKVNIVAQKQALDQKILIKDLKLANQADVTNNTKSLKDLEAELEHLISRENDIIDLGRLTKNYQDLSRDAETEFMRKNKSLKEDTQTQIINMIQDNAFGDLEKQKSDEIKYQIRQILYDIEEYEVQKELNIDLQVSYLKSANGPVPELVLVNKDIKFFYQLEFIERFKQLQQKQEVKQNIQNKLKKINDNISELDKLLQNSSNTLDNLQKEASYLKESEFSPVKGRQSIVYGVKGDLEKENELQQQNKQIEQQVAKNDGFKQERDKLKKLLKQYHTKFDDLDLENSNIIKLEELIDEVNTDLDYRTDELKKEVRSQTEHEMKAIQDQVQNRIDKFASKRQVLSDCRQEEKEKRQDILRCDGLSSKLQSKLDKLEKDLKIQIAGFTLTAERQQQLTQDQKDLQNLRDQKNALDKQLDDQKLLVHRTTLELTLIGDKIVSLEHLKTILGQLQEMNSLKKIQDLQKALVDQISLKEAVIEQFISDILGGSMFDCERKFKEAEQLVDRISKRIIEINNDVNDFEIDIKKGLHLYSNDDDIQKEGKKQQEENTKDRKEIKGVEDQKNLVRKVLHKIRNSLNEQEQLKSSQGGHSKLTAGMIEEFINEIDTCAKKTEVQDAELTKIVGIIDVRKEQWSKFMFKGGAKEALVDDVDKAYNDQQKSLTSLQNKLVDAEKVIKGLEDVSQAMSNNADYEVRKNSIKKILDAVAQFKTKKAEIESQIKAIQANIQKLKDASNKGLRTLTMDNLSELAKLGEETSDLLAKEHKKADSLLRELTKKRQKLGDADIGENFKTRNEALMTLEDKAKNIEIDQAELDKILQEANKVSPGSTKDSQSKINEIKKEIAQHLIEKDTLKNKVNQVKDKIRSRDLYREDPSTFAPLIKEVLELKSQLEEKDKIFSSLANQLKFFKNKHGGIDFEKKFQMNSVKAQDLQKRLNQLKEDNDVLKELFEEFDGYTSDTQEEDFIDKLGLDIKEISAAITKAQDFNERLTDKVNQALKGLAKGDLSAPEIEKRAQEASEIEEDSQVNERQVADLSQRVHRNKRVFQNMEAREKLSRREQECIELTKRLVQFDSQVQEIESTLKDDVATLNQQSKAAEAKALEEVAQKLVQVKKEYQQPGSALKQIHAQLEQLKRQEDTPQFELLKKNIQIKKQILSNLALIKQARIQYNQLRVQYENNRPRHQISYKPVKGDYVDQLLADWVNNNSCPVPISRLGNGFYMFGSKKIFAKIINGKLLIRVGGGYMGIDEFMFYYGAQELNKMLAYEDLDDEELDLDRVVDTEFNKSDLIKQFNDGKSVIGGQQFKKRLSPRPGSPRR
eukprot:403364755